MSQFITYAQKDLPLYKADFIQIWDQIEGNYQDVDLEKNYQLTLIFKNWKLALNHIGINDLDLILEELNQDTNASFYLANYGLYRTSLMHLRSSIELTMQLLYFFDHKIEFSQWTQGEFVIKHADLSKYLIKHPSLQKYSKDEIEKLMLQVTKYWKEFSKYIHAEAPKYFQSGSETHFKKSFNQAEFNIWKSKFQKSLYILNKLMLLFFIERYNEFPSAQRDILMWNVQDNDKEFIFKY